MKNIIAITIGVVISVLIGTLFANLTSKEDTSVVVSSTNETKAFQVGSYTNFDNASIEATNKNGIVVKDGSYYCVYVSVLKDTANINKMVEYLNKNNIYYYIKNITISSELESELVKYEELMKNSSSDVAFMKLNEQILKLVGELS
jgi:hypothetical protein